MPAKKGIKDSARLVVLLVSVFIIATCGILYELLISTISTYFLGSSVLHFSITIGLFMSFMGVGSYLSKFINDHLLERFVFIEILLGVVGGCSALVLYFSHSLTENYHLVAFLIISALGTFIGLEIPLVARIINQYTTLKDTLAQVLSFDYIGALIASIVFPLLLLPYFGTMRTAFLIGILNLSVAAFNAQVFRDILKNAVPLRNASIVLMAVLAVGFAYSFKITTFFEQFVYQDEIILTRQSAYQRVVLTRWNNDFRLYLNGALQFSTVDEHRYHETLVHVPMQQVRNHERVLLLGGGDGLAAREILKYADVVHLDVVDLDAAVTDLGKNNPIFKNINHNSFNNPKVKIYNQDAFNFVKNASDLYSVVIIDLPDPNDPTLGKLYSREFYNLVVKRLTADGLMATQATSPYFATDTFWCIAHTVRSAFGRAIPYTTYVPSFGQWGFIMASKNPGPRVVPAFSARLKLRYLNAKVYENIFDFDPDMADRPTEVNRLDNQIVVQLYEQSLKNWQE